MMPDCQQQYPFKIRVLHCAFKDCKLYGRDAIVGGMLQSVIARRNSNRKQYLILGVRATRHDVVINFEFSQLSYFLWPEKLMQKAEHILLNFKLE